MTLPSSGPLRISDISQELGLSPTFSASLNFLNSYLKPPQAQPTMSAFYGKAYFQNNNEGNCNNGNCSNQGGPNGNCTSNCNCGNIQCNNCVIAGPSDCANCANCGGINCTNCDTQPRLQPNCNCSSGYNCTQSAVSYNCTTGQTSYNCNCACNCSKIVCAKLYDMGLMDQNIWAADQAYGQQLRKTDRRAYRGYIKWARIVTAWMDGRGPVFMPWIKDSAERNARQQTAMTEMAYKIGTPWSQHMAYLMGAVPEDNSMGRILMNIGKPICQLVSYIPKARRANKRHGLATTWTIWALLYFSYYTAAGLNKLAARKNKKTLMTQEVSK